MIYQIPKIITPIGKRFFSNTKFPKTSQLGPNQNNGPSSSTVTDIKAGAIKTPKIPLEPIQPSFTPSTLPKISHRSPNPNGYASSSDVMQIQDHKYSIKFPKISHLPFSERDTQASGFCFDPKKIKKATDKIAGNETSSDSNIKPVK
ncbi:hypothetical protein HOG98_08545 [bacterium]|jgi:hypothetical protein|nr:hypothetical protein [bacterium]